LIKKYQNILNFKKDTFKNKDKKLDKLKNNKNKKDKQ
jgi:hypothetical protein